MSAQDRATVPAGAQNPREDETPFRKFISVAQVRREVPTYSQKFQLTGSPLANPPHLCGDAVRFVPPWAIVSQLELISAQQANYLRQRLYLQNPQRRYLKAGLDLWV